MSDLSALVLRHIPRLRKMMMKGFVDAQRISDILDILEVEAKKEAMKK